MVLAEALCTSADIQIFILLVVGLPSMSTSALLLHSADPAFLAPRLAKNPSGNLLPTGPAWPEEAAGTAGTALLNMPRVVACTLAAAEVGAMTRFEADGEARDRVGAAACQ